MKSLTKEELIALINKNFKDGDFIFKNDFALEMLWEQFGDDYFIENNRWVLTKKNTNWVR